MRPRAARILFANADAEPHIPDLGEDFFGGDGVVGACEPAVMGTWTVSAEDSGFEMQAVDTVLEQWGPCVLVQGAGGSCQGDAAGCEGVAVDYLAEFLG